MSLLSRCKRLFTRPHVRLIALVGVIVPCRLRFDWRQEWEAELRYRELLLADWDRLDWRNKLDLLRRSTSAFWDALWLQSYRWEDEMLQDLRYGVRMLLKNKVLAAIAVLSLAVGIGANTAIFSVIDALMLKRLPVRNPEQLVTFKEVLPDGFIRPSLTYSKVERLQGLSEVFSGILATAFADRSNMTINGSGGGVDEGQVRASLVTGNYFVVLGVNAAVGRTFTEDDDRVEGGHPATVISDAYWARRFGRAADVVGRTITLNNTTFTIVGVTQRGFSGESVGRLTDLWFPVAMAYQVLPEFPPGPRGSRLGYQIIGRLKSGMTIEHAQAAGQCLRRDTSDEDPFKY